MGGLDLTGNPGPDIVKSMYLRLVDQEGVDGQLHECRFEVEPEIGLDETGCSKSWSSPSPETVLLRPAPYKGFGTSCLQLAKQLALAQ
jgi:hypothetical protein